MLKLLVTSLLILATTSSLCLASDFDENNFQNGSIKAKQRDNKRIAQGVYLLVRKGTLESRGTLMRSFTKRAISLTRRKGYNRFAIFNDIKGDGDLSTTLETAMRNRNVREFYIRRIKQKSPQIGKVAINITTKGGLVSSQRMYGIIVMMKGGKLGLPADASRLLSPQMPSSIREKAKAAADKVLEEMGKEVEQKAASGGGVFGDLQTSDSPPASSTDYFFRGSGQ